MTLGQLILYMMIGTPQEREVWRGRVRGFCERHIVADDPYDELTARLRREREERAKKIE